MRVISFVVIWGVIATVVAATGLLAASPVPPPVIAFGLTAVTLLLLRVSPSAREQTRALGAAPLVAVHVVRLFAGAYFLVLYRRGSLPGEFALSAGWGDILVGIGAILVLWRCIPPITPTRRSALLVWNVVGLVDILVVLGNGIRIFSADPGVLQGFAGLPLALLPIFVVPLVISTHLLLYAWYARPAIRTELHGGRDPA